MYLNTDLALLTIFYFKYTNLTINYIMVLGEWYTRGTNDGRKNKHYIARMQSRHFEIEAEYSKTDKRLEKHFHMGDQALLNIEENN